MGGLELVYMPPPVQPTDSGSAVNLLISLERILQATEDYVSETRVNDIQKGLVVARIEEPLAVGATQMLERFTLSPRLRVWIVSPWFNLIGEPYARAVDRWLEDYGVDNRTRFRLGYTNLVLANAVHYDTLSIDRPANQVTAQDVFDVRHETRQQRLYRGEARTA